MPSSDQVGRGDVRRTVSSELTSDDLKAILAFKRSSASLYFSSCPVWGLGVCHSWLSG
jgi:hypothetical protein